MPKFSISTLLWGVCACAIIIAVVMTQRALRENAKRLAVAAEQISAYRDELGKIAVSDPVQYHIRHFKDRYTSDTEFRWRIHVPDASNCNIYYAVGKLPQNGFPESPKALIRKRLPKGTAELVLVAENREGDPGDFRIGFYPEFEGDSSPSIHGRKMRSVEWMPWFRDTKCTYENPPFDSTTVFNLDQPFIIMKHYATNDAGDRVGYMFWIEEFGPAAPTK
jgi:hypothetical protein